MNFKNTKHVTLNYSHAFRFDWNRTIFLEDESTSSWQRFDAAYFIKFLTGQTPLERGPVDSSCRVMVKKKKKKKKREEGEEGVIFFSGKIGRGKIKRVQLGPGTARCHVIYQGARRNDRIVPREESIRPRFPRRFRVINRHAPPFVPFVTRQLSNPSCIPPIVDISWLEVARFREGAWIW